jgi:hypothetical protein
MNAQSPPKRSWFAIASVLLSLFALCTLPLPLIPSTLLGVIGMVLGGVALWRINKKGGTNRDRFFAFAGIGLGLLPVISLCFTLTFLAREIPRWAAFAPQAISKITSYLSLEIPKVVALLSNLFR